MKEVRMQSVMIGEKDVVRNDREKMQSVMIGEKDAVRNDRRKRCSP